MHTCVCNSPLLPTHSLHCLPRLKHSHLCVQHQSRVSAAQAAKDVHVAEVDVCPFSLLVATRNCGELHVSVVRARGPVLSVHHCSAHRSVMLKRH
jgi:hypothetical protein